MSVSWGKDADYDAMAEQPWKPGLITILLTGFFVGLIVAFAVRYVL